MQELILVADVSEVDCRERDYTNSTVRVCLIRQDGVPRLAFQKWKKTPGGREFMAAVNFPVEDAPAMQSIIAELHKKTTPPPAPAPQPAVQPQQVNSNG